jgi:predicted PurR-regulated permease PerM
MPELYTSRDNTLNRTIEVALNVGLLILLIGGCLLILRPFLPLILWGIIIAIAVYPGYRRLQRQLGGRCGLSAVICTSLLLAIFIVPVILLTGPLIEGVQNLAARLTQGTSIIPPPPARVETWPLIGAPLKETWDLASKNVAGALKTFAPQIKAIIPELLAVSANLGLAVLELLVSILVAGFLLANAASGARVAHSLAIRFFGERAQEFEDLAGATIRSVTTGIIGVALIQSVFAALGFIVGRLPGAGVWALIFLFGAVLQVGALVLVPAVIYMFAIASTTKALVFLGWCVIVGLMDNVLKPLLLGRGVAVPMAVVFLGAIGGLLTFGTVGLFVGAVVLSIGYKLSLAWLDGTSQIRLAVSQKSTSAQVG